MELENVLTAELLQRAYEIMDVDSEVCFNERMTGGVDIVIT